MSPSPAPNDRPPKIEVPTSVGTVTVGALSWFAYREAKRLVVSLISGPIAARLTAALSGPAADRIADLLKAKRDGGSLNWTADDTAAVVVAVSEELRTGLQPLVEELYGAYEDLLEAVARGSVQGELPASLTAGEMLAIREKALEVNDVAALLAMEKNSFLGAAAQVMRILGSSQSSAPAGTSGTSTSSPAPTAGPRRKPK